VKTLRRAINGVLNKSVGLVNRVTQQARDLAAKAARSPVDNALERAVADLPPSDYALLIERESGLTYHEIAKKRGMSERAVLRSLARTYADLRMKTMPGEDPPGNDVVEVKCDQAA
jgi:DNA-directed RNA polymerase specialized sigma24 family protein